MPAAILLDQRGSRRSPDLIEEWRSALRADPGIRFRLPFERTAGDEMEALVDDPASLAEVALRALRSADWSIGIGIGPVNLPLPTSVRAASGDAFVLARRAVRQAKARAAGRLCVIAQEPGGDDMEAALLLMRALYARRPQAESRVIQLRDQGLNTVEIARRTGVTKQAVSKHLLAAHWAEEQAGRGLVHRLAQRLLR